MNFKQIISIIVIVLGIGLIGYGFYGKKRMSDARGDIDSATGFVPDGKVKGVLSKKLYGEVDKYAVPVMLLFVGGIACVIIGGVSLYKTSKK